MGRLLLATIAILGFTQAGLAQSIPFMTPATTADLTPRQNAALQSLWSSPTTKDVQIVTLDPKALVLDNVVKLAFKKQNEFALTVAKTPLAQNTVADKISAWFGTAEQAVENSTAMAISDDGDVEASIQTAAGLYRISPIGGGVHAFVKVDTSKLPADHPPGFNETVHGAVKLSDGPTAKGPARTQISVLVAYTPAVARQKADMTLFVQLAFNQTNLSYQNSGINIELVPATPDPVPIDFVEKRPMRLDLDDLAANPDIQRIRAASHANLVVLLISDQSGCGWSKQIYAAGPTAFSVVHYDCVTSSYAFAHEIGHLQGAHHNPEDDPDNTPYAYGHGFMDPANNRRTIMSVDCPHGCTRALEWARPLDWGNAAVSNDARVLNETAAYIVTLH
jgi:hypothetical protein